jgi:hypothetical protein
MPLAYDILAATPISRDPFPHVVVRAFVPSPELDAIIRDLPPLRRRGSFPVDSLAFGPAARGLMDELAGPDLRGAIAAKFGLDLDGAASMLTLRGASSERDGHIHRDSATKRVTVLLYLNREAEVWRRHEGCLRLLRGADDIDDYAVEVPPVNGTLLVFPNGPDAWHGHQPYVGPRCVVQLNYMADNAAARSELRRHRISAFVKRLAPPWTRQGP